MQITLDLNTILIVTGTVIVLYLIIKILYPILGIYFAAHFSNVHISFLTLIAMKIRGSNFQGIVNSLIVLKKKGIQIDTVFLEAHFLAGGDLKNLTEGIIYAKEKELEISNKDLAKADLNKKKLKDLINKYIEDKKHYGDEYTFDKLI